MDSGQLAGIIIGSIIGSFMIIAGIVKNLNSGSNKSNNASSQSNNISSEIKSILNSIANGIREIDYTLDDEYVDTNLFKLLKYKPDQNKNLSNDIKEKMKDYLDMLHWNFIENVNQVIENRQDLYLKFANHIEKVDVQAIINHELLSDLYGGYVIKKHRKSNRKANRKSKRKSNIKSNIKSKRKSNKKFNRK